MVTVDYLEMETIVMGNEMYEAINKEAYPTEVSVRVMKFVEFVNMFKKEDGLGTADVGCGNKFICGHLKGECENYDYYPADDTVRYCDLLDPEFIPRKPYDNVVLSHVFEHFTYSDGMQALQNIHKNWLIDGGHLFISVPNCWFKESKHEPYNKEWGHLAGYNADNLKRALTSNGFHVTMCFEMNYFKGYEEVYALATRA
jgi:hypothetical protein